MNSQEVELRRYNFIYLPRVEEVSSQFSTATDVRREFCRRDNPHLEGACLLYKNIIIKGLS